MGFLSVNYKTAVGFPRILHPVMSFWWWIACKPFDRGKTSVFICFPSIFIVLAPTHPISFGIRCVCDLGDKDRINDFRIVCVSRFHPWNTLSRWSDPWKSLLIASHSVVSGFLCLMVFHRLPRGTKTFSFELSSLLFSTRKLVCTYHANPWSAPLRLEIGKRWTMGID